MDNEKENPKVQEVRADNNGIAIGEINISGTVTGNIHIGHTIVPPIDARLRYDLGILLKNVETTWIKGVLEKSVYEAALLELGMELREQAVDNPWRIVMEKPDQSREEISKGRKIKDIFDEANRLLLILGEPGSGKTTTLLQLARDLIAQVDETFTQPIPVILNLSTWINKQQPLNEWLVLELSNKYRVPKRDGKKWLQDRRILPLLDGLDEVKAENRVACVEKINQLLDDYGLQGLVVCSRAKDYTDLTVRLAFYRAIYLQPLTSDQVDDYLNQVGDKLAALRSALQSEESLRDIAQSPLILSVMSLAYQDALPESLSDLSLDSGKARIKHLFDTYIAKMFNRKAGQEEYEVEQTKSQLSWLAWNMQGNNQDVFLIENLQPTWLSIRNSQRVYFLSSRLINLAIPALSVMLLSRFDPMALILIWPAGLILGFIDLVRFEWFGNLIWIKRSSQLWWLIINFIAIWLAIGLTIWLIFAPIVNLAIMLRDFPYDITPSVLRNLLEDWNSSYKIDYLAGSLFASAPFGFFFGLRGSKQTPERDIQPVEALLWSWNKALKGGLVIWLISGIILWLSDVLIYVIVSGWSELLTSASSSTLAFDFSDAMIYALNFGFIGAIYYGLHHKITDTKSNPNEGIRLSIRNALLGGLIIGSVGLLSGLIFSLVGEFNYSLSYYNSTEGLIDRLTAYLIEGLDYGIFLTLASMLWYGGFDVVQHYTLRLILILQGHTSRNYARFLDYAVDRIFLQKVGGGYRFIHRMLLEHFAEMHEEKT